MWQVSTDAAANADAVADADASAAADVDAGAVAGAGADAGAGAAVAGDGAADATGVDTNGASDINGRANGTVKDAVGASEDGNPQPPPPVLPDRDTPPPSQPDNDAPPPPPPDPLPPPVAEAPGDNAAMPMTMVTVDSIKADLEAAGDYQQEIIQESEEASNSALKKDQANKRRKATESVKRKAELSIRVTCPGCDGNGWVSQLTAAGIQQQEDEERATRLVLAQQDWEQVRESEQSLLNDREFKRELVTLIQDRKRAGNPISNRVKTSTVVRSLSACRVLTRYARRVDR